MAAVGAAALLLAPGRLPAQFVEIDSFEISRGIFHVIGPSGNLNVLDLGGPTTVHVTFDGLNEGDALDDDMDGRDEVVSELVSLDMAGQSNFGPVAIRLDPNVQALGEIEERVNAAPGTLDLPPFAPGGDADSFFDVSFEADVFGLTVHTEFPVRISTVITEKPPPAGEVYIWAGSVRLLFGSGFPSGGRLERVELELQPIVRDFGDAPDPMYPTLLASNGAQHDGDGSLKLGASWDREFDGQPTAAADGDGADEDGVAFTTPPRLNVLPTTTDVDVTASQAGRLDAWVDFDLDGSWAGLGEKIFSNELLAAGVNSLQFDVPTSAELGCTYARFRLSSAGGLDFDGLAADGEVEDYRVEIVPDDDLDLFNMNLVEDRSFFAANSITAGGNLMTFPDFSVLAPANVVLHAGNEVIFRNGVLVEENTTLTVILGPVPGGCPP